MPCVCDELRKDGPGGLSKGELHRVIYIRGIGIDLDGRAAGGDRKVGQGGGGLDQGRSSDTEEHVATLGGFASREPLSLGQPFAEPDDAGSNTAPAVPTAGWFEPCSVGWNLRYCGWKRVELAAFVCHERWGFRSQRKRRRRSVRRFWRRSGGRR